MNSATEWETIERELSPFNDLFSTNAKSILSINLALIILNNPLPPNYIPQFATYFNMQSVIQQSSCYPYTVHVLNCVSGMLNHRIRLWPFQEKSLLKTLQINWSWCHHWLDTSHVTNFSQSPVKQKWYWGNRKSNPPFSSNPKVNTFHFKKILKAHF